MKCGVGPWSAGARHALSYGRVADVEARQGERQRALDGFKRGRDIIAGLRKLSPDTATFPRDLAWFDRQVAALEK